MNILKGKALDILRTFSKDEIKKFESFINSPYFNSNKSIARLTTELSRFYPEFNSETMTEAHIYAKVFGKNKFSYSVIRNLMSELLGLCEKFLLNERLNNRIFSNPRNVLSLLEEFQLKNLDKLFDIRLKKITRDLKKEKFDSEYYSNQLSLTDLSLDFLYNKIVFKKY